MNIQKEDETSQTQNATLKEVVPLKIPLFLRFLQWWKKIKPLFERNRPQDLLFRTSEMASLSFKIGVSRNRSRIVNKPVDVEMVGEMEKGYKYGQDFIFG
ncbi:hypothetical protein CEXT_331211 [Caerostris extrusa]|uniref:Uncharacterized protein n=1 Tax=Caerostris extrusa TaxID=172846 RepID=A0AAV4XLK8_CAEEX|nr:hypothetical protein CEXT_331211 [Caerostris extrusa]